MTSKQKIIAMYSLVYSFGGNIIMCSKYQLTWCLKKKYSLKYIAGDGIQKTEC